MSQTLHGTTQWRLKCDEPALRQVIASELDKRLVMAIENRYIFTSLHRNNIFGIDMFAVCSCHLLHLLLLIRLCLDTCQINAVFGQPVTIWLWELSANLIYTPVYYSSTFFRQPPANVITKSATLSVSGCLAAAPTAMPRHVSAVQSMQFHKRILPNIPLVVNFRIHLGFLAASMEF